MRSLPARWEKYAPVGCRVPGTRFIPFKVPLKMELLSRHPDKELFTPSTLVENVPTLKAVIDLTNTDRYYNSEEFTNQGILYRKISVMGQRIPSERICNEFFDAVDQLCRTLDYDSDALIGVHCTHGLNRTGYLICKYMVLRMKIDPQEAINKFEEARGHHIERSNYVSDILEARRMIQNGRRRSLNDRQSGESQSRTMTSWRDEPRLLPSYHRVNYYDNRSYKFGGSSRRRRSSSRR